MTCCHISFFWYCFLLVNALSKKYGKGKKTTMKCQSCSYEKEIYSSGVHTTEGGSLMVYGAADDFFCPNCNTDDTEMETIVEKPGKHSMVNIPCLVLAI